MKATKSALPIATWLMLIFFMAFLFVGNLGKMSHLNWGDLHFYLSTALVVFSIVLLVGKIISRESLTALSSLIICIVLLIKLFAGGIGDILSPETIMQFLLISMAFFVMSKGN